MTEAFICDPLRTAIGRYAGALSPVRTDDLAAVPIKALVERNKEVDWAKVDDVVYGCANQAGEDNRNVARMALLLAGLPVDVPGSTVNRLCGSGLNAVANVAAAIKCGDAELTASKACRARPSSWARPRPRSRAAPRSTTRPSAGASSTRS